LLETFITFQSESFNPHWLHSISVWNFRMRIHTPWY